MSQNQTGNTTQLILPYNFSPSGEFDGNDGSWSTFSINVGDSGNLDGQNFRVLISTGSPITTVPLPAGWCTNADCAKARGIEPYQSKQNLGFQTQSSKSWQLAGTYNLPLLDLDYYPDISPNGSWGFDTVGLGVDSATTPQLANQFVVGTNSEDFFMGSFGLAANPVNFGGGPHVTFLKSFNDSNQIPSLSYGYTAGASYRNNNGKGLAGSLILGGYDQSRFTNVNTLSTSMTGINNTLQVGVQSIDVTTEGSGTQQISMTNEAPTFNAIIDSSLPYLWLPQAVCDKFADTFRLTYDNATELYTVNASSHSYNTDQNATISFKIGANAALSNSFTSIALPYAAFDLEASSPIYSNATKYFPIKQSPTNQYVLGRTFLQEAYLVVDYERNHFTLAPTNVTGPAPSSHIVTIHSTGYATPSPPTKSKSGGGLSPGAIAGIAVGVVILVLLLIAGAFFFWRRRKQQQKAKEKDPYPPSDMDTTLAGDEVGKKRRISELDSEPPGSPGSRSVTGHYAPDKKDVIPPISEMETPPVVHELESPPLNGSATPRSPRSDLQDYFDGRTRPRAATRDSSGARRTPGTPGGTVSGVAELPGDDGMFQVHGQHFEPVGGHSRGPSGDSNVPSGTLTAVSDPTTEQLEEWALGRDAAPEPQTPSDVSSMSRASSLASRSVSRPGFRSLERGRRLSETVEEPDMSAATVHETAEEHQH